MKWMAQLTPTALEALASAICDRRLGPPWSVARIGEYVSRPEAAAVAVGLHEFSELEMTSRQIARVLALLASERRAAQEDHDRVQLVWSGPEQLSSGTRETSVVVRDLFQTARRTVVISSFGLDQGEKAEQLFRPLAESMRSRPELKVRMFLNIKRSDGNRSSDEVLVRQFAEAFTRNVWPWPQVPELYYDPRSLQPPSHDRACLHAKCISVDDERLFVTSANFTQAAQHRNIEAGVLLMDPNAAREMRVQFEGLVESGIVIRVG